MSISSRLILTVVLMVPAVLIPVLEINGTHLFNPLWPPHARLHEAWQLLTNATLALLGILGAWSGRSRVAALIGMVISGSFLGAWLLRDLFGGSMGGTATSSATVLGVDAAAFVMAVVLFASVAIYVRIRHGAA